MEDFIMKLPKVELHAHLNGSLDMRSIQEISAKILDKESKDLFEIPKNFYEFEGLDDAFGKFKWMHTLTTKPAGLLYVTKIILDNFAKDHIYLELRTTPKNNSYMSKREYLECVINAIKESKKDNPNMLVKLLPSIDRSQSVAAAEETLDVILDLRKNHSNILTGMDLSGNPLKGFFKDFVPVLIKARECGLKLALHCAEIDNANEIAEMIDFGMDRCGHGTFLTEIQLKQLAERNVPIECCLTSNVWCKTVDNYKDHHFKRIFDTQQPVVVCTDDCGVFDTSLTKELCLAAHHYGLQRSDLRRLTLCAIENAFVTELEKKHLKTKACEYFDVNNVQL